MTKTYFYDGVHTVAAEHQEQTPVEFGVFGATFSRVTQGPMILAHTSSRESRGIRVEEGVFMAQSRSF